MYAGFYGPNPRSSSRPLGLKPTNDHSTQQNAPLDVCPLFLKGILKLVTYT